MHVMANKFLQFYVVVCLSVMVASVVLLSTAFIEGGINGFEYTILMNDYGEWGLELGILLLSIPGCLYLFHRTIVRLRSGDAV